jgi:hypothetical protein
MQQRMSNLVGLKLMFFQKMKVILYIYVIMHYPKPS